MENLTTLRIVFIGAGNLATRLSLALRQAGMPIVQVYSRTKTHAIDLANRLACAWTTCPEEIRADANLYFFSLKDDALPEVIAHIRPNDGLWVHTAGSLPMSLFVGHAKRYGVMYPLQTFSKGREVDFKRIPFFLEADSPTSGEILQTIAKALSEDVRFLSSEQRKSLHLAAVFACNFTNHMYRLAGKILEKQGIPEEVLLPLIDETAAKVHSLSPAQAQTGPAVRYDKHVIDKHLAMLDDPSMRHIYEVISQSIHKEIQQNERHSL